jgi:hypothetical protein
MGPSLNGHDVHQMPNSHFLPTVERGFYGWLGSMAATLVTRELMYSPIAMDTPQIASHGRGDPGMAVKTLIRSGQDFLGVADN